MKYIILLALVVNAIKFDSADVSDLFNDDSDEAGTLKSIAEAEKAHGVKLDAKDALQSVDDYAYAKENS